MTAREEDSRERGASLRSTPPPPTIAENIVELHHKITRDVATLRKQHEICEASHAARVRDGSLAHLDSHGKIMYYMAVDTLHFHTTTLFTHELDSLVRIFHLVQNRVYGDCYQMYVRKEGDKRQFPRYDMLNPEILYSIEALTMLLQRIDDIIGKPAIQPMMRSANHESLDASHVLERYMMQMDIQAHSVAKLEAKAFQDILALHLERLTYIHERLRALSRLVSQQQETRTKPTHEQMMKSEPQLARELATAAHEDDDAGDDALESPEQT